MILESVAAQRARRRPWAETVYLLRLTLLRDPFAPGGPSGSMVLRLSDRAYRYPEPRTTEPLEQWLPLVLSWGQIGDALNPQDGGIEVAGFDVTLDNTRPIGGGENFPKAARFSDLLRAGRQTAGFDLPFSPAELLQVFRGLDAGSRSRLFRLVVEELGTVTEEVVELKLSGIELVLEDRDRLPRITTDVFPFAAPSVVGQPVPLLLGTLRRVPLLFVRAGLIDKLRLPIKAAEPQNGGRLVLSTPDIVARLPPQGTVQLRITAERASGSSPPDDDLDSSGQLGDFVTSPAECISYNGTDPATASLLGIIRGARNTMSGEAEPGTEVYQVLDEYWGIAGVNLGPTTASAMTAVYCDGMFKEPAVPPQHSIEIANTTVWPGQSVNLVRFKSTAPADVFAGCVEIKEIARLDDGRCYAANTVSGTGNEFRTPAGVAVVRCGLDAPCGMPVQFFEVWFRFPIAALPLDPGAAVVLRFFRGVHVGGAGSTGAGGMPPGYGVYDVELVWRPGWVGPIAGGHGSSTTIAQPPPPPHLANVLAPGVFLDQYVFVDVSTAYQSAKQSNAEQVAFGLKLIPGQTGIPEFTANWYSIGATGIYLPALMLGVTGSGGSGALLTRPNVGSSANSAAEASLGEVTVDITGPGPVPPDLGIFFDAGIISNGGLGWSDFSDSRPGHGPDIPLLPPITCASGAEQGDNYCEGPPSFVDDYSSYSLEDFNNLHLSVNIIVDYTTQNFRTAVGEWVYAGLFRGQRLQGTELGFVINSVDSGRFTGTYDGGPPESKQPATLEVVAFDEPLTLAELQNHTHDTIGAEVRAVLGTFQTDNPHGPFQVSIGTAGFIGFRIKTSSFPEIPGHAPEGAGVKNYTAIILSNITIFSGTSD